VAQHVQPHVGMTRLFISVWPAAGVYGQNTCCRRLLLGRVVLGALMPTTYCCTGACCNRAVRNK